MERIKALSRYQKGVLLILIAMLVAFGVIYCVVSSQGGFLYHDVIFVPIEEDGNTVYFGTIDGQTCSFTVTADKSVTFQCGEVTYGPYTAREDPSARPADKEYLTGIEILEGDQVFFRGGVIRSGDGLLLFEENGEFQSNITIVSSDGIVMDSNGEEVNWLAPSPITILELMDGPKLTSKVEWEAWICCVFLSVLTAASILFADELFRWNLVFRVRDVDLVEPSDWEVASRYISWTLLTIMIFALYMKGLQ